VRCCLLPVIPLAEWFYEAGIGENRAALVDQGSIVEIAIERHGTAPRAGSVHMAKLVRRFPGSDRSLLTLPGGGDAVGVVPARFTEGATVKVVVIREAIPEAGNPKPPVVRIADEEEASGPGPSLLDRLERSKLSVSYLMPHQPDLLEQAEWSEWLDRATSGLIPFPGGLLRMSLTPAMTLFDIDGTLSPSELAVAGAAAAARAIRLFDIGGSIGLDLPIAQTGSKSMRAAAAAAVDEWLPQPFERTAVNGFGFLQIVQQRVRPSLPELMQSDPVTAAALALLRRAERTPGHGKLTLNAAPAVIRRIAAQPDWQEALARRRGCTLLLSERPGAAISDMDVETEFP